MNAGPGNSGDSFRRRDPERGERPPHDAQRPLPPQIYRRRRIAAIAGVVVVILLLWWLLSSLGGSDEDASTPTADTAQSSSAAPASGKDKKPATSESKKPKPPKKDQEKKPDEEQDAKPKDPAANKDTCELADLRLTAVPGKSTFDSGEQPNFYVKIANPTKGDCVIDVDEDQLLFEVFAMDDYHRVWGDLDCNEPSISGEVTIEAGKSQNYEMGAWSRTTSAPDQCEARQPVGPGSYLLYAHLGDNVSQPATFNMS